MRAHWPNQRDRIDVMRATGDETAAYATGWTVSGLATLVTIVAVWMFAI